MANTLISKFVMIFINQAPPANCRFDSLQLFSCGNEFYKLLISCKTGNNLKVAQLRINMFRVALKRQSKQYF